MAVTATVDQNHGRQLITFGVFAASGDTSPGVALASRAGKVSVATVGTYTGGLSLQVQGSNDGGVTWIDLGVTAFTANAIRDVPVLPDLIRVAATAGTGAATVSAYVTVFFY